MERPSAVEKLSAVEKPSAVETLGPVQHPGPADSSEAARPTEDPVGRFQVVPAAYVVFRRDDRVLLQLRQNTGYRDGYWASAAAGHVEADESVLEAACREAVEELGVGVRPADLTPLAAMHRTHGNHQAIDERVDFFFECRRWDGEPRLMETVKAADLRWFALAALPELTVPHERYVFENLAAGTLRPIVTFGF